MTITVMLSVLFQSITNPLSTTISIGNQQQEHKRKIKNRDKIRDNMSQWPTTGQKQGICGINQ